mgnify:CR=1 FL=1
MQIFSDNTALNTARAFVRENILKKAELDNALKINEQCIEQFPDTVFYLGLKASILGHLNRAIESNKYLKQYLNLRPNLKTRSDYKKMFIPNSVLADTIIDGLIKAGWKPED